MSDHDPDHHITDNDAYLAKKRERFKEHMQRSEYTPKVGDGVYANGIHYIVRQLQFDGGKMTGVWGDPLKGTRRFLPLAFIRHETFGEFLHRPTGFGKTPWAAFIALQILLALFIWLGFAERSPWSGLLTYAVVNATLVFGSWMNYTGRWK